jgi:DNA-binding XRE family transcriptional regulator
MLYNKDIKKKKEVHNMTKQICNVNDQIVNRVFFNYKVLKLYRAYFGFTQDDLAYLLGVPYQQYQKWEKGVNVPSIDIVMYLSQLYNMDINTFFS